MFSICVVRPYDAVFRVKVFAALETIGAQFDEKNILEKGTIDSDVIRHLSAINPDVLLMPFHAHEANNGEMVDGVNTLRLLSEQLEYYRKVPVIMPVAMYTVESFKEAFKFEEYMNVSRVIIIEKTMIGSDNLALHLRQQLKPLGVEVI